MLRNRENTLRTINDAAIRFLFKNLPFANDVYLSVLLACDAMNVTVEITL